MTLVIMAVCFDDHDRSQKEPSWNLLTSGRKSCVIACCDTLISNEYTKFDERNVAKVQKASWIGR
jgi:hypothetical protein